MNLLNTRIIIITVIIIMISIIIIMIISRWVSPLWSSTSRDWEAFWPTLFDAFAVTFLKGDYQMGMVMTELQKCHESYFKYMYV